MKFKILSILIFIFLLYTCISFTQENLLLTDFRFSTDDDGLRLVFDLSDRVQYNFYREGESDILNIEFIGVKLKKKFKKEVKFDDSLIEAVAFTETGDNNTLAQLKLKYPLPSDKMKVNFVEDPPRVVCDLYRKFEERSITFISPGVIWTKVVNGNEKGRVVLNYITAELKNENLQLRAIQAMDNNHSREQTSSMALRTGALVAINGGYYNVAGGPLGLIVMNGALESPPVKTRPPRTVLGITDNKTLLIDRVDVKNNILMPFSGKDWSGVLYAIGAGPNLITDGKINITDKEEELGPGGNDVTGCVGHTVIGTTEDDKLIMFSVDDRNSTASLGMNLKSIAKYLLTLGVKNAMNMDGGDSATMVVIGKIISNSYAAERKVANAWGLYDSNNQLTAPQNILITQREYVKDDSGMGKYKLEISIFDGLSNPVRDGTGVFFKASYGFPEPSFAVTKNGKVNIVLTSMKMGEIKLLIQSGIIEQENYFTFE